MNRNNQKGFTLILSLVLLLVMSLMGGSLIVISSSDHQSNNTSDEYQQTFYVAEHALIEAEKYVINQMIGPWKNAEGKDTYDNYVNKLQSLATNNNFARQTDASSPWPNGRGIPTNIINVSSTPCSNSFRNLLKDGDSNTLVAAHQTLWNFGELIEPILTAESAPDKEIEHMKRYRWEFFVINVGRSTFKGAGTSLKKTSTNAQQQGNAYKLYGCGYLMPKGTALTDIDDPEILIPLETLVILSG
ncbi:pilus assembly protein PilZ [Pelagibacteraceae bacterium]|jgi:Tfp pilus assembly protein PilX|nr:pilus assembly protein PilZ [Pelagibacteraceae bacterium]